MEEACSAQEAQRVAGALRAQKDNQNFGDGYAHDVLMRRVKGWTRMQDAAKALETVSFISRPQSIVSVQAQAQDKEYLVCYLDLLINGYKPD
jgi:hypothetical protein